MSQEDFTWQHKGRHLSQIILKKEKCLIMMCFTRKSSTDANADNLVIYNRSAPKFCRLTLKVYFTFAEDCAKWSSSVLGYPLSLNLFLVKRASRTPSPALHKCRRLGIDWQTYELICPHWSIVRDNSTQMYSSRTTYVLCARIISVFTLWSTLPLCCMSGRCFAFGSLIFRCDSVVQSRLNLRLLHIPRLSHGIFIRH